jgi:dTDP-4-amino-4,6-dideoxygalactose transaminase
MSDAAHSDATLNGNDGVIPVNDLSRAWLAQSEEALTAIQRVLSSGWYVHGQEHQRFESELAAFLDVPHALGVANGSDALVLALLAVGCGPGAEMITAANAGGYASLAGARAGSEVTYADVDPTTLLVTPDSVADAIGPRTRAVVVTHLYGNVAEVETIVRLCRARGVTVIEDCAQALGGTVDGVRVGTIGDVGTFSFYPTKNLGAAGDGGAIATRNPDIARSIERLRQYGWRGKYRIEIPGGFNSRLDEMQAAILRIGLPRLDSMNERRRSIVARYAEATKGPRLRFVTMSTPPSVAHLAVVRTETRERVQDLLTTAGIRTDIHYPIPDHQQPGLRSPARERPLPETERAANEVLTLPCFPELTEPEIGRVCAALREASTA